MHDGASLVHFGMVDDVVDVDVVELVAVEADEAEDVDVEEPVDTEVDVTDDVDMDEVVMVVVVVAVVVVADVVVVVVVVVDVEMQVPQVPGQLFLTSCWNLPCSGVLSAGRKSLQKYASRVQLAGSGMALHVRGAGVVTVVATVVVRLVVAVVVVVAVAVVAVAGVVIGHVPHMTGQSVLIDAETLQKSLYPLHRGLSLHVSAGGSMTSRVVGAMLSVGAGSVGAGSVGAGGAGVVPGHCTSLANTQSEIDPSGLLTLYGW